jgi:hypothetical protein
MTAKLRTAEDVLEWAGCGCCGKRDSYNEDGEPVYLRRATAERLAKALRVLEAVEEMEHMPPPEGERPDCIGDGYCAVHAEEEGVSAGWNACLNTFRAALDGDNGRTGK